MKFNSPETFHQWLSLRFHLMIALPLAVFVYLFLEMKHDALQPIISSGILQQVVDPGLIAVGVLLVWRAYSLFRNALMKIRADKILVKKLEVYGKISMHAYLILGLASGILVVGLFLTTSAGFIVAYVLLLFLLSIHRPTPRKYVEDLHLVDEQKEVILKKKEFSREESES